MERRRSHDQPGHAARSAASAPLAATTLAATVAALDRLPLTEGGCMGVAMTYEVLLRTRSSLPIADPAITLSGNGAKWSFNKSAQAWLAETRILHLLWDSEFRTALLVPTELKAPGSVMLNVGTRGTRYFSSATLVRVSGAKPLSRHSVERADDEQPGALRVRLTTPEEEPS